MTIQRYKFALPLLGFAIVAMPSATFAMTAREGFVACDKNPKCKPTVLKNGDVIFSDGSFFVLCPQEGQCDLIVEGRNATPRKVRRPAKVGDLKVKAN